MSPKIGVNFRITGHCNQGERNHMEDVLVIAYEQTTDQLDIEYAFFGIFDGHGGVDAAYFARDHLMKNIVTQPGFYSDNNDDICQAIKDGFIATHYEMWKNFRKWPKTPSGLPSTSGSTASVAFIRKSTVFVGHVGDSRIILGKEDPETGKWYPEPLTVDHKPDSPKEYERIRASGGDVTVKSGVARVVWQRPSPTHKGPLTRSTPRDPIPFLAIARSLGDLWSYNHETDQFVVSPIPDVTVHPIDLSIDRCLVLGSDGLFNVLKPKEVVEIVQSVEANNQKSATRWQDSLWKNPSKTLVDRAIRKWCDLRLRADNTTAMVLLLDQLGPPNSPISPEQPRPAFYRLKEAKQKKSDTTTSGSPSVFTLKMMKNGHFASNKLASPASPKESPKPSTSKEVTEESQAGETTKMAVEDLAQEEVPVLIRAISLEDTPVSDLETAVINDPATSVMLPTTSSSPKKEKGSRRSRKRKLQSRSRSVSRRDGSLSDNVSDYETRPTKRIRIRRRARSAEPPRSEESDAENTDAPMRLRSGASFRTLRSRNIILETSTTSVSNEPRPKRLKK